MPTIKLTQADTKRAREIWSHYQQVHDVTDQRGRTAGIDPISAQVWIADSIEQVLELMNEAGNTRPLYFIRVGSDHYYRKGGHR